MIKNYGFSQNLTYKFHNYIQEENEKKKDNNDSDNLIEEKNIKEKQVYIFNNINLKIVHLYQKFQLMIKTIMCH